MLFHHICIQTGCYRESLDFYTRVLGMRLLLETPGFHGRDFNTWLEGHGLRIELQTGKRGQPLAAFEREREGIVHFALYTDRIEQCLHDLQSRGCSSFLPKGGDILYQVNGGQLFKLTAPEGTIIEVRDGLTL